MTREDQEIKELREHLQDGICGAAAPVIDLERHKRKRILTDTPEKEEIEKHHEIKIAKRKKERQLPKKPEFEIEAASSEELSDIEVFHSTDDSNSTVADMLKKNTIVKFLKNIARSNKFLYDKEETYEIDKRNIVFKLQSDSLRSSLLEPVF
ncbi:hypothetical protein TNCV_2090171 [Trichonephila clavipes]|nr:hypothetical protein TNCV_2090171 [Trichonephila clavipes]